MGRVQLRSSYMLINHNGDIIMGSGRLAILESIDMTGSINKTAKILGMSYKTVWSKIKSTEKNYGKPVVVADRKMGTSLTREGRTLIKKYKQFKQKCIHADDKIFSEFF